MRDGVDMGWGRLGLFALCVGCGPAVASDDSGAQEGASTSSSATSSGSAVTSGPGSASTTAPRGSSEDGGTTLGGSTSSTGGSSSETGQDFISDPTVACGGEYLPEGILAHCSVECAPIHQDCGQGEACKPWANDGGDTWNGTVCRPVDSDPGQAGEMCSAEVLPTSGVDSCDVGLMCWNVSGDALEGECVEFCGGTEMDPTCEDALDTCSIFSDFLLPLCLPACDPLAPTCEKGLGCYPGAQGDFVCVPEGARVSVGEVFHPECPVGTFAATDQQLEGCSVEEPCCSAYCDLNEDAPCDPYFACVPLAVPYAMAPDVGACVPVD